MRVLLLVLVAALVIPVAVWMVVIPETTVLDMIGKPLQSQGFTMDTEGFVKGPLFSVTAQKVTLGRSDPAGPPLPLLTATDVSARLDFASLLRLSPHLDFEASIGQGSLAGTIALSGLEKAVLKGTGIQVGDIPFFRSRGISGDGRLSCDLQHEGDHTELKLIVEESRLRASSLQGIPLPLDLFQRIRGSFVMSRGSTEIRSLALEGKGIYARLKGTIRNDVLTSTVEVSIDTSVRENALVAATIGRYMVTPGYFVIPVNQRLSPFTE